MGVARDGNESRDVINIDNRDNLGATSMYQMAGWSEF